MEAILGLIMMYTMTHFFFIQNKKNWDERSLYERIVTSVGIFSIVIVVLSVMFG